MHRSAVPSANDPGLCTRLPLRVRLPSDVHRAFIFMQSTTQQWLSSDTTLGVLILSTITIFALWAMPFSGWRDTLRLLRSGHSSSTNGTLSLETAAATFYQYQALSLREVSRMRASYSRLGRAHKRIGYELGYPRKLDQLAEATRVNAAVAGYVAQVAKEELSARLSDYPSVPNGSLHRAREALRHFVRDWSEEGGPERIKIFEPILSVLREIPEDQRSRMRILVPGCGLGRLAWEISELGEFHRVPIDMFADRA